MAKVSDIASAIQTLSKSLVSQYETIFEHSGDVGHSREAAVIEFLRKVSPEGLGFSKGEMFDADGATSGEVDVIIYDKVFCTVFQDGSGKILAPIESTFGAIEVKSTLTTTELDDCARKISKYRVMNRPQPRPGSIQVLPHQAINLGAGLTTSPPETNRPTYGVLAFRNQIALPTLLARIREIGAIDYVVVPGEFLALGNSKLDFIRLADTRAEDFVATTPAAVALWIMTLQLQVQRIRLVGTNKVPAFLSLLQGSKILH